MKHKFHWINPKLKVRKTSKRGFGTFASRDLKKGELLIVSGGYVMPLRDEERLPDNLGDNGVQITENLSICVAKREELGGINFLNHSCNPNVGIRGQIFWVAMRRIKKGEEVTCDYAMALCRSKNAKPYRLKCLCGKKNCRGVITDDDWKNRELQRKYDGYFQYFLQERINKLRSKP